MSQEKNDKRVYSEWELDKAVEEGMLDGIIRALEDLKKKGGDKYENN